MALEDIRQAVIESARREADRVIEAAQRAADEKLAAEVEVMRREAERRYVAETRAIEEEFGRKLVQHKGAANKQLLERRNQRLREVFAGARQAILDWSPDEYGAVMGKLLARCAEGSGGVVRVHGDDRGVFEGLVQSLNAERDEDRRLRLDDEPLPERGGFVFVSRDFEVDQTLDTLLSDLEHEMSPRIAAQLFGKQT